MLAGKLSKKFFWLTISIYEICKSHVKCFAQIESDWTLLENVSSSISKHYKDEHSTVPKDLNKQFSVLKKCNNKFDCLVHEMLLFRKLTPFLNVQSDSIRARLSAWLLHFSYMPIISQKNVFDNLSASILNLKVLSRWHQNVVLSCPRCFYMFCFVFVYQWRCIYQV